MNLTPEIILDVGRLAFQRGLSPTGIDRVEMTYFEHFDALIGEKLSFCAYHPIWRRYCFLDKMAVRKRMRSLASAWQGATDTKLYNIGLMDFSFRCKKTSGARVILKVSPDHLQYKGRISNLVTIARAPLIVMIHDLLPIEFPEFSGRGGERTQRRRLETVTELAAHIIANSQDTADSLQSYFKNSDHPPITAIPLGYTNSTKSMSDSLAGSWPPASTEPYFLCIGTIEPRKNHMMLLHIWRRVSELAGKNGRTPPKLYIVGRRGWENENIIDLLERSPAVRAHIVELGSADDATVSALLRGARALLAPSFAEGFGLPIAEALAMGTPVICSDIPPHREVGGDAPEYVDPLDGPKWLRLICDYALEGSAARQDQLRRLNDWSIDDWEHHILTVYNICKILGKMPCKSTK